MKRAMLQLSGWMWLVVTAGCAGTGQVIPLQLHPPPAGLEKQVKRTESLRVAVGPFEDRRNDQRSLGVRTHLWGGISYFDVQGSKPADAVAQALTDYLTAKGWRVVKPGNNGDTDVAIAGKLEEFFIHAKSRVGFTEITTRTKLAIHATNQADGSVVRMILNGSGAEDVFWFDREDVQKLVNDVLADSFSKLIQDTTVENKQLRLRSP